MTFAAPIWLAAAGVAALLVVGLHLLARRTPRTWFLPTARFIPDRPARATAPASRPTDLLLLLFRVVVILLLGTAFARPVGTPPRHMATIVALDRSRATAAGLDPAAAAILRAGDIVIAFDSTATRLRNGRDSVPVSGARGSLSVALLAAMRAAPQLSATGDSIDLAVLSPFAAEEWDRATLEIRRLWPGRIRLVPVAAATLVTAAGGGLRADSGDPLVATVALLGGDVLSGTRLIRTRLTSEDSAWATLGGTLVYWPAADSTWTPIPGPATGVVAGNRAVVAPFAHRLAVPVGEPIARWADGTPAATERPLGSGCERDVGIPFPTGGDIALRPSVLGLVRALTEPCGGTRRFDAVPPARLDSLRGSGGLLATSSLTSEDERQVPARVGLLVAAGLLLLGEPLLRRRQVAR